MTDLEPMLTGADVCRLLNIHRNTLLRWTNQGRLRGYLVGNAYRYRPTDVQAFLDRVPGAAPTTPGDPPPP